MKHWTDETPQRDAVFTVRVLWVAIALSLLIHVAALWVWIREEQLVAHNPLAQDQPGGPLTARLAPTPTEKGPQPPSVTAPPAPAAPTARVARPPAVALRPLPMPRTAPAVITERVTPVPDIITAPPVVSALPVPPLPATPPPATDLASYIAARRLARGEADSSTSATPSTESETARRDRIVAQNLASLKTPSFGNDPRNSGGLFEIRRLTSDEAEFMFFGWNKEIKRRAPQLIEVRRSGTTDIRVATVRRMITIIREHEQGDFSWESRRLGRIVQLSARTSDTAELEDFLGKEFFSPTGAPR